MKIFQKAHFWGRIPLHTHAMCTMHTAHKYMHVYTGKLIKSKSRKLEMAIHEVSLYTIFDFNFCRIFLSLFVQRTHSHPLQLCIIIERRKMQLKKKAQLINHTHIFRLMKYFGEKNARLWYPHLLFGHSNCTLNALWWRCNNIQYLRMMRNIRQIRSLSQCIWPTVLALQTITFHLCTIMSWIRNSKREREGNKPWSLYIRNISMQY